MKQGAAEVADHPASDHLVTSGQGEMRTRSQQSKVSCRQF